jgi:hypothetical protein
MVRKNIDMLLFLAILVSLGLGVSSFWMIRPIF